MNQQIATLTLLVFAAGLSASCATAPGARSEAAPGTGTQRADVEAADEDEPSTVRATPYGPVLDPSHEDYYHIDAREHIRRIESGLKPIEVIPTGETDDSNAPSGAEGGDANERFGGSVSPRSGGQDR